MEVPGISRRPVRSVLALVSADRCLDLQGLGAPHAGFVKRDRHGLPCPHDQQSRRQRFLTLPIEEGAVEDGGSNEVGEALEAGSGGGRGDHGFFLVGEADVDLGSSLHEGSRLRWVLTGFEHRRNSHLALYRR